MDAEVKAKIMELLDSPAFDNYLKREQSKTLLRLEHERDALESNLAKANADLSVWKETAEKYMKMCPRPMRIPDTDLDCPALEGPKVFVLTVRYGTKDGKWYVMPETVIAVDIGAAIRHVDIKYDNLISDSTNTIDTYEIVAITQVERGV